MRALVVAAVVAVIGPWGSLAQESAGKWCTRYLSMNGDGTFEDCVLVHVEPGKVTGLKWSTAQCTSAQCSGGPEEKPRITAFPKRVEAKSAAELWKALKLEWQHGAPIDKGGTPRGEDAVYEPVTDFAWQPSFNCAKAKQPREQAICSSRALALDDQELALTFARARICFQELRNHRVVLHGPPQLEKSQAAWWSGELARCQSGECVPGLYAARVAEIRKMCPAE